MLTTYGSIYISQLLIQQTCYLIGYVESIHWFWDWHRCFPLYFSEYVVHGAILSTKCTWASSQYRYCARLLITCILWMANSKNWKMCTKYVYKMCRYCCFLLALMSQVFFRIWICSNKDLTQILVTSKEVERYMTEYGLLQLSFFLLSSDHCL